MNADTRISERYIKFDFKMSEKEYKKLRKTAWLLDISMADFIRDAMNLKYLALINEEIRKKKLA